VLASLAINSLAGFAFARLEFRGRDVLFFAGLVGLMIPPQASMVPTFLILKNFPLAGGNNILGQGGLGYINTFFGLMAPYLAGSFGVFLFRQYFLNFPKSLDDAAKIDGLSRFGSFLRIYVPLSTPVFASLMCLKATQTWNEYVWPLIITTSPKMMTLQLALVLFKSDLDTQWNHVMAASAVITLPLIILFIFAQKTFVAGIATSGIKG
jgi:multiple sugar transport system permease protein